MANDHKEKTCEKGKPVLSLSHRSMKQNEQMAGGRVLIADKDPFLPGKIRDMLETLGYLVVGEATDGSSTVEKTRHLRPDIVLADVDLPHMDGIAVAQALSSERLAPVVLLTTQSTRELVARAGQAGASGLLIKPIQESDLMPTIEVACARWELSCSQQREKDELQELLDTRVIIERAKGHLMDTQGLREVEAFRKIQKMAMNNRRTMKEVAQAILLARQIEE
jgi:response regulator NasT